MEMQKYGCMLKISSFGAILLAYDMISHEGAQNEPNLPLCPWGVGGWPECIFVITEVCGTTLLSNIFQYHQLLKWLPGAPPSAPGTQGVRGRIRIAYSVLSDMKDLTFNWLFWLKWAVSQIIKTLPGYTPKSTRKYLLDGISIKCLWS